MDEEKKETEKKEIKILPSVRRLIHSKLAQFCTESRGSDLYHLMEVVEILRANVGEEPLEEYYKEKYPQVKAVLHNLNVRLNKIKLYYDSIHSFDDSTKEKRLKKLFNQDFVKIPLISSTLFKVFNLLIDKTEIRFMSIPNEAFKRMDKEHKVLDTGTGDRPEEEKKAE